MVERPTVKLSEIRKALRTATLAKEDAVVRGLVERVALGKNAARDFKNSDRVDPQRSRISARRKIGAFSCGVWAFNPRGNRVDVPR